MSQIGIVKLEIYILAILTPCTGAYRTGIHIILQKTDEENIKNVLINAVFLSEPLLF